MCKAELQKSAELQISAKQSCRNLQEGLLFPHLCVQKAILGFLKIRVYISAKVNGLEVSDSVGFGFGRKGCFFMAISDKGAVKLLASGN